MTRISVVIPTYNRASLIQETLASILAQSRPADEIIVVDDGSKDDTLAVLAKYGERLIVKTIPNSGDLVARNVGLRAAEGELVAFCDSDDLWHEDFLEVMAAQWRQEPALNSCYANFRILRDGSLSRDSKFDAAPAGFWDGIDGDARTGGVFHFPMVDRLLKFQPLFTSCMMVSKERFLALGGWDEGTSRMIGCDFATALRSAAAPPLGIVGAPLVSIRKHAASVSHDTEKMNLGDAQVLDYVRRTRPELAPLEGEILQSIAQRRAAGLDSAFSRGDFAAVRQIYSMLPPDFPGAKLRAKHAIAGLPSPWNSIVARFASS
ncbi:MAG TPA: glycosyltransferase family A protein [Rhizomicrobium sp.]|nr:glycosyltransferase family A protein [Rhizomicrobium sp.]